MGIGAQQGQEKQVLVEGKNYVSACASKRASSLLKPFAHRCTSRRISPHTRTHEQLLRGPIMLFLLLLLLLLLMLMLLLLSSLSSLSSLLFLLGVEVRQILQPDLLHLIEAGNHQKSGGTSWNP